MVKIKTASKRYDPDQIFQRLVSRRSLPEHGGKGTGIGPAGAYDGRRRRFGKGCVAIVI